MAAGDALGRQFDKVARTETVPFHGLAQPHAVEGVHHSKHLAPWHATTGYAAPGKGYLEHIKAETNGRPWLSNN